MGSLAVKPNTDVEVGFSAEASQDEGEPARIKHGRTLIKNLDQRATETASQGLNTFELTVLSYRVEPVKAFIPFVKPHSIWEYSSPAYHQLWQAVADRGLEPFLAPNPLAGNDWAGSEEGYSKFVLAVRIPETHELDKVRRKTVKMMGFDPLDSSDPEAEVKRYQQVSEAIKELPRLRDKASAAGKKEFDVMILSYEAEPAFAMIPFVCPTRIDQYASPAYQQLWEAVEKAGLEPVLKLNPSKNKEYAEATEAYSKLILAARIVK